LDSVKLQSAPARVKFRPLSNFHIPAANQLHQLQSQLSNFDLYGSCKSCVSIPWRAENLKKLEIYDIIKGWGFRPAQKIQLMSNFAFRANLCYNIYVR
jgi:hypothetical protein